MIRPDLRSPIKYILFVALPILIYLLWTLSTELNRWMFFYIVIYFGLYRVYIDSLRLYQLRVIDKEEFNKWYTPFGKSWFYGLIYYKELYSSQKRA